MAERDGQVDAEIWQRIEKAATEIAVHAKALAETTNAD